MIGKIRQFCQIYLKVLNPLFKAKINKIVPKIINYLLLCTIWDDVGTYLTSSIDPKEKASLTVAFAHFKKEKKQ